MAKSGKAENSLDAPTESTSWDINRTPVIFQLPGIFVFVGAINGLAATANIFVSRSYLKNIF